ncbi:putative QWRF family protein [Helianthus annuus]|nr:putative QWRF family protein [Helianthus annuus]
MDAQENPRPSSNVGESNEGTHRHGRSRSGWGLSTAVHAVHGVGFVAKKVINNRYTDSLWHTRKSSSSASGPSDGSSDAKRENHSHETASHHSSQPSLNVEENEQPTHEREDVPLQGRNVNTTGSNVGDQLEDLKPQEVDERSENKKPTDGSHVKSVNQHRWPSSSTAGSTVWPSTAAGNSKPSASSHGRHVNQHRWPGTTSSNVVNQSENLEPSDGSHAKPVNQHRWPGTAGSNVLNKTINNFYEASRVPKLNRKSFPYSKPSQESSTNATNPPSSSVVDDDKVIESQPSSPNKSHVLASRGVSPLRTRAFTKGVKPSHVVRGASLTPATRGDSDTTTTRESSLVSTRGVSPTPSREVILTPARGVSPTPSRGISPTPSTGVSPTPTREVGHDARDVSPTPMKPHKSSGRRHFFSANILSVFTKIVDNRKEKHVSDLKEAAQHLELLYNIQVQWQFANASAEAALDHQRKTAEKSLSDVWRAILELRDSLASKKVDMTLLILQLKLYAVLYRQMAYIDEWASIQKEHESALFATANDLQARSLSLPITGGVKLDKTHFLASELANLVLHERALLDECEIFLASAAPLHVRAFITMTLIAVLIVI